MAQKDSSLSNYTIPKRKVEDKKEDDYVQKSILDNSSYNVNQQGNSYNPQPGRSPSNTVQPIAQNIWNTLSTIKEKPKGERRNIYPNMFPTVILTEPLNFYRETLWGEDEEADKENQKPSSPNSSLNPVNLNTQHNLNSQPTKKLEKRRISEEVDIFREMVPDVEDQTLPKELTSQFQPLYCKLCSAQLSSNVMAKLHYKSKNHEKKVRKFLIEYSEKTGEPLHKRAKTVSTAKPENERDPLWFYCEVCDLPLTGKMHAESHYMGKNHQKVVMGHKAPAGKGFYDSEGKWVRQGKPKNTSSTEDTFGLDFRTKPSEEKAALSKPPAVESSPGKFQCSICNVGATCQEQIDMHFKGQKHQKKLKHFGLIPPKLKQGPSSETDILSVYITPSGGFYCPICNLSLNSEMQFKVHLNSKGHVKKSAEPRS